MNKIMELANAYGRAVYRAARVCTEENQLVKAKTYEALQAEVVLFEDAWQSLCEQNDAVGKACAELEAEIAALREDAERYRWLRDNVHKIYARQQFSEVTDYNMKWQIKPYLVAVSAVASDVAFDDAVDMARSAK